jgi:hypothetical protein
VTGERLVIEAPLSEEWTGVVGLGEWRWDTSWRVGGALPAQQAWALRCDWRANQAYPGSNTKKY